jgi:3-mercaptopyruvate sulfurtransferase SseA
MRLPSCCAALVILGAILLSACNSAEQKKPAAVADTKKTTPASQDDGVRRVTVQELQDLLTKGQAVVIDVRNQAAFDQGHIKGAKLIPFNEIQNRTGELPKDKLIVTYCS